jgi:tight adherence protein C
MIADRAAMIGLLMTVAVLLVAAAAMLLLREGSVNKLDRRIDELLTARAGAAPVAVAAAAQASPLPLGWFGQLLRQLGERLGGATRFYSEQDIGALESAITAAGLNGSRLLPMVLGAKVLLAVLIPVLAIVGGLAAGLRGTTDFILLAISLPLGLLGPDWALHFVRRPYVAALRRGLPDALDLLVVCTEAGMGLESALDHVATEIAAANPAIAVALSTLLDELRVLPDRREAFANFGRRSGVEPIRRLATMLGQTLNYGTPLADALRAVSTDLRRERMIALEARCARLPALLVLPLMLFIMPALFIVLAGSPVLQLFDSLHSITVIHAHH